jgi:hypothetical protein
MLDRGFCDFLEYEITRVLRQSDDVLLKYFWCDGVLLPDSETEYSKKFVNSKRRVVMKAFAGQTGQDLYELTLRFGPKALSRYSRDLSIKECVPDIEESNWLEIDIENKKIVVQLT